MKAFQKVVVVVELIVTEVRVREEQDRRGFELKSRLLVPREWFPLVEGVRQCELRAGIQFEKELAEYDRLDLEEEEAEVGKKVDSSWAVQRRRLLASAS
jgi:hypothetical protein